MFNNTSHPKPEALLERFIEDIGSGIAEAEAIIKTATQTIANHEHVIANLTAQRTQYQRALAALQGRKTDAGTVTAKLRLDTTEFDEQVADAKATLKQLREG